MEKDAQIRTRRIRDVPDGSSLDAYTDVEGTKGSFPLRNSITEYYKDVVIAGIITSWRVMFSEGGHRLAFIKYRTGQVSLISSFEMM